VAIMPKGGVGEVDPRTGCVAVAESIHCPPKHNVPVEVSEEWGLPVGFGFGG
jgi:hypothetical protein